MKTAFIINPSAGRGKTAKVWEDLKYTNLIVETKGDAYFTTGPGDAKRFAKGLSERGYKRVFVLGGDGTVNEVINGLKLDAIQLGIVPTGTGNDFCRMLAISNKPKEAIRQLLAGKTRIVDIGEVNGRRFLNTIGVGFDAEVARTTNEEYQNLSGTLAYLAAITKVLREYKNEEMVVETEGITIEGRMLLIAIGNGSYFGGGMKIVPQAVIDDGIFHLCLIGDASKLDVLKNVSKLFSGNHLTHPKISSLSAKRIAVKTKNPVTVQADGEIIGKTPIEVAIIPKALEILIPIGGNDKTQIS
ncbi:MAG: diacylglycerol kinase family protein [Bacillota bacterium]